MNPVGARGRFAPLTRLPWVVALPALLAVARIAILVLVLHRQAGSYDLTRYFDIAKGGFPYRDQPVEYPPVTVAVIDMVHAVAHARQTFGVAVIVLMALVEAATCLLMWRAFGRIAGLAFVALDTIVYYVLLTRVDIVPTALTVVFLALLVGRRSASAGIAWAAAEFAKLWPLPLGVFMLTVPGDPRARMRAAIGAAVTSGIIAGGWIAAGGIDGIRQVLTFRGAHGWQIESMVGAVLHATGGGVVTFAQGSDRIGEVPPVVGTALQVAGIAGAALVCLVAGRRGLPGTGWLAAVLVLLATSTLLSPQFLVWTVPGAALAIREARPAPVIVLAAAMAVTLLEVHEYPAIVNGGHTGQAVLLFRNALVLLALLLSLLALSRRGAAAPS